MKPTKVFGLLIIFLLLASTVMADIGTNRATGETEELISLYKESTFLQSVWTAFSTLMFSVYDDYTNYKKFSDSTCTATSASKVRADAYAECDKHSDSKVSDIKYCSNNYMYQAVCFWNEETTPTPTPTACTDSDGGIVYTKKGTVTWDGDSWTDVCLTANNLEENYCSNGVAWYNRVICDAGCSNGICLTPTNICTDSDGGKIYDKKGTITINGKTQGTDYCGSSNYLMEYYCGSSTASEQSIIGKTCDYGCSDGICKSAPTCTNGAIQNKVCLLGTAAINAGCDWSDNVNRGAAQWEQCVNNEWQTETNCCSAGEICIGTDCVQDLVCGNGILQTGEECDDGNTKDGDGCSSTCTNEGALKCTDSDADQGSTFLQSFTTGATIRERTLWFDTKKVDSCSGSTLTEYYCSGTDIESTTFTCSDGCITTNLGGACKNIITYVGKKCLDTNNLCLDAYYSTKESTILKCDAEDKTICVAGCANDACIQLTPEPTNSCVDDDGGLSYSQQGIVKVNGVIKGTDKCTAPNLLTEYYCNNPTSSTASSEEGHFCIYGCDNGVCKAANILPTFEANYQITNVKIMNSQKQTITSIQAGEKVLIEVTVKNIGDGVITIGDFEKLEVALYADSYASSQGLMAIFFSLISTKESIPCGGMAEATFVNSFRLSGLLPGEEGKITATLTAPTTTTKLASGESNWDDSFQVVTGIYQDCDGGYINSKGITTKNAVWRSTDFTITTPECVSDFKYTDWSDCFKVGESWVKTRIRTDENNCVGDLEEISSCSPTITCDDGTAVGTCSNTKPLYCDNEGSLINNGAFCGCPANTVLQNDGSCKSLVECNLIGATKCENQDDGAIEFTCENNIWVQKKICNECQNLILCGEDLTVTCELEPLITVCGADGVTYDKSCLAKEAGTTVSYVGECKGVKKEECKEGDIWCNYKGPIMIGIGVIIILLLLSGATKKRR